MGHNYKNPFLEPSLSILLSADLLPQARSSRKEALVKTLNLFTL